MHKSLMGRGTVKLAIKGLLTAVLLWLAGTTVTIVRLVRRSRAWPFALGTMAVCALACVAGIGGYLVAVGG